MFIGVIDATVQHLAETTACGRRLQCGRIIGMAIDVRGIEIPESQTAAKIAKWHCDGMERKSDDEADVEPEGRPSCYLTFANPRGRYVAQIRLFVTQSLNSDAQWMQIFEL